MMDLKLFLLISMTFCVNFMQNETFVTNDLFEKWAAVGIKAVHLEKNGDLKAAIALVDTLGKAIPSAGAVSVVVSGIMGLFVNIPSDLRIVLNKLEGLNDMLEHLDDRIDEIISKIESVSIIAGYKSKLEQITRLKHKYERFISTNSGTFNKLTRDDFIRECKENKMLDFIHWINKELNSETLLPIKQVMLQNYDMRNFNLWANQIAAVLSKAMYLHFTCVGASDYNKETILQTLYGRTGKNDDIKTFERVLANVKRSFYKGMKQIRREFFPQAKREVKEFMRIHANSWPHDQFVEHLHSMLSAKYYWRTWVIYSWNGNTRGFDQHTVTANDENVWVWLHSYNRCLMVGSVLKASNYGDTMNRKIDNCHLRGIPRFPDNAREIHNYMSSCISGTPLGGLAVVQFGNGLVGYPYEAGLFMKNSRYFSEDFSVFAIPSDSSATISEGEVCSQEDTYAYSCSNPHWHCCAAKNCCAFDWY